MSDFVVEVSQPGYDVDTCADWQLSFSSRWPLLKIEKTGTFTITDTSVDTTIYTHNLGYNPAFWVFVEDLSYPTAFTGSMVAFPGNSQFIGIDATKLRWYGGTGGYVPGILTLRYFIFRYDMSTIFTAPISNIYQKNQTTPSQDFIVKVSKEGKDIDSTDLRDFAIHSETRSPMIHMSGTYTQAGVGTKVITHNLGYEPMFLVFVKQPGYSYYTMITSADDSQIAATPIDLTISTHVAGNFFYIIFKDPVLL